MASTPGEIRPVLGQKVDIGCLYDGHNDSFLHTKIFTGSIPGGLVNFAQVSECHVRSSSVDSVHEKFSKLCISNELGASFLTGLVPVHGAAAYLESHRGSNRIVEGAIYVDIARDKLELNLKDRNINGHLSREAIQNKKATHIVTSIAFGTRIVVSVRVPLQDDRSSSKKRLDTALDQLKKYLTSHVALDKNASGQVERDATLPTAAVLKTSFNDLSFGFLSDITAMERFQSLNIHEIVQIIQGLPFQLRRPAEPILCRMMSMERARAFIDIKYSPSQQATPIPDGDLQQLFGVSAAWTEMNGKLCDLFNDLNSSRLPLRMSNSVLEDAYEEYQENLRDRYAPKWDCGDVLVDVRRGKRPLEELRRIILDTPTAQDSPQELSSMIDRAYEKLEFQKRILADEGKLVDYAGAQTAISSGVNVYVLYFTDAMRQDQECWATNQNIIFNLLKRNSGDYLVVAAECDRRDIDFVKPRVTFYNLCDVAIENMAESLDFADECWARYEPKDLDESRYPLPADRRLVRISCPLTTCGPETQDWNCYKCRSPIEYSEEFIYCKCGRANAENYRWQCNSDTHGKKFVNCRAKALKNRLEKLHSYKDLNILILGETGVGKSTWINAFYNYIMFETLDDAMAHNKLEYVIPTSFSMQFVDKTAARPRYVQTNVRVGEFGDAEVDGMTGDSGTQRSSVYRIPFGNTIVRLIDTPGVGDVRGVEADRKNLSSILQTLNRISSLHGIVILLKPNTARLNLMFRFCVKELLTYLHRDAARNIVWGFTNTRQSNYMPGDSYYPLQRLLQEHQSQYQSLEMELSPSSTFCFDSESFRCLAAKKQAEYLMPNQDDFRKSWQHSAEETRRLLKHCASLEPHLANGTLSLNRSREIILQLTMPIADIVDVIERTIRLNQEEIDELKSAKSHKQALEKCLHYSKIEIEHHWQEHMHICFSQVERVDQCTDQDVQSKINEHQSAVEMKKQGISTRANKIAEFQAELEQIRNAAARFGLFLKNNSIVAYNDAMIRYLDELIKEEAQTVAFNKSEGVDTKKNEERLRDLEKSRRQYQERVKVLGEQMGSSDGAAQLDEQGVEDLVKELYALPTWGKNLQDMQTAVEWSKAADFQEQVLQPKVNKGLLNAMKWVGAQVWSAAKGLRFGDSQDAGQHADSPASSRSKRRDSTQDGRRRKSRRLNRSARSPSPYY
ncbi:hypothetical protein GGR52DRAFT_590258 [Hypoxylon sp. FL1284]|nr:hypothetical protein GGR52DRAFT_590258 [Hypoxylon sp. FL1284]